MPTNQWLHGYFSKLNPLAEKIAFDMSEVISAYDHVWLTLTPTEQDNILNDTIIKPEITIRYYNNALSSTSSTHSRTESEPRLNKKKLTTGQKNNLIYGFDRLNIYTFIPQSVGLKILHDENIGDYRDEHSFPFSYKTKSQMNLTEIGICKNIPIASTPKKIPPFQTKTVLEPEPQRAPETEPEPEPVRSVVHQTQIKSPSLDKEQEETKKRNINRCTESTNLIDVEKCNLLSNFGSKNTLLSVSTDSNDSENDTKDQHSENCKLLPEKVQMPKGFDFLSNW